MTVWREMLRRFRREAWARVGKNAVALLVAQAGARALNLVLIALLTRALGVAGLGRYLVAMTVQTIALAVSDLGLNTYTVREFSREGQTVVSGLWKTVLGLKLVAAFGALLVLNLLVAPFLGGRRLLVAIVSLSLLPDAYSALAAARIKAQQRMEVSAAITLGTRLAYSLLGGLLLWRGYDERALLAAYGGVSTLGALAFGLVLRRRSWAREAGEPRPSRWWDVLREEGARGPRPYRWQELLRKSARGPRPYSRWRYVMGESLPFAITGTVAMLYTRADLLVLSFVRGDTVAGRYGMAYRLWEAMGMIPASFLDALFPELSRLGGQRVDQGRLRALYRRGWQIVGAGAVLLAGAIQVAATTLITVLYGRTPDAALSVGILRVLLLAFPFTYLYLLNGHTLYAVGQQQRVTVAMTGVTATKLLLDALVVPRWSTWGAAGAALASEVLLFVWLQFYVWRFGLRPSVVGRLEDLAVTGDASRDDGSGAG